MRRRLDQVVLTLVLASFASATIASAQTPQYTSTAGVIFKSKPDTGGIARAARELATDPRNVDKIIALGLAQATMQQYKEAVATFTRGMAVAPNNALLYRWRGHRYISIGQFDKALADFKKGYALDSTNYGILYHTGVAHFIRGEYAAAAAAFTKSQSRAPDANEFAGSTDWLWTSASRAKQPDGVKKALATVLDTGKITSATAYFQRLRLYHGFIKPEQALTAADTAVVQKATISFGVGNWYLVKGDTVNAKIWFKKAVDAGGWPGFGFFAAESELRRLR